MPTRVPQKTPPSQAARSPSTPGRNLLDRAPEPRSRSLAGPGLADEGRSLSETSSAESLPRDLPGLRQTAAAGVSGAGQPLPHLDSIQASFGRHDVGSVAAYTGPRAKAASQLLGAEAYATGERVAFRELRPSLHAAAHEAAHVLQQRAGAGPRKGVDTPGDAYEAHAEAVAEAVERGESAEPLLNPLLDGVPDACCRPQGLPAPVGPASVGHVVQRLDSQFAGPPRDRLPAGQLVRTVYGGGHTVTLPTGFPLTNACNGTAKIETAGEKLNSGASKAATPTNMKLYSGKKEWSQGGGLLHDPSISANHAATKMHALNHRLDIKKLNDPAQENIFLGTQISNNPNHLDKLEKAVLASLKPAVKGNAAAYEAEMMRPVIQPTKETTTKVDVLYWPGKAPGPGPGNANIDNQAIKHASLQQAEADNTNYGKGVRFTAPAAAALSPGYNELGQVLVVDEDTANENYYHSWLDYRITPQYKGIPDYIPENVEYETSQLAVAPQLNLITPILAVNFGELGRFLQSLLLPVPVADVALILGEAVAINPANAVAIVQAMGEVAAASVVRLLPVADIQAILGALPSIADRANLVGALPDDLAADVIGATAIANAGATTQILAALPPARVQAIFDQLPAAERGALTGAGFAAPFGPPSPPPAMLPGVAAASLPPAAAAPAPTLAQAAEILQGMDDAAAATAFRLYPAADAAQILAAVQPANALDPLLAAIPADHAADIVDVIAGTGAANAYAVLNGLGIPKAGTILQYLPLATVEPILTEYHQAGGAAASANLLQHLPADHAAAMLDLVRLNVSPATAVAILGQMRPNAAAALIGKMPMAAAGPLLGTAGVPPAEGGKILRTLPANHAAEILNHLRANFGVAHAGDVFVAITQFDKQGSILRHLPAAQAADLLLAAPGDLFSDLRAAIAADIVDHIVNHVDVTMAAGLLQELDDNKKTAITKSLPVASTVAIVRVLKTATDQMKFIFPLSGLHIAHIFSHMILNIAPPATDEAATILNTPLWTSTGLKVFNELPTVERQALALAGAMPPQGTKAPPAGLGPLGGGPRPPGALPGVVAAVAPALIAGPAGPPNVAPGALPAGLAPGAALPIGAALGAPLGAGNLAGTIENVLNQLPPADLLTAFGTLSGADAMALAGALPGAPAAVATLKYRIEKLGSFPAWAKQACPTSFHAEAKYYTASYKPGNPYYEFHEQDIYSTDLQ